MRISDKIQKQLKLKWSSENSKLKKDSILSFNIPAYKSASGSTTCFGATLACSKFCYASQGMHTLKVVQNAYEHNLNIINNSLDEFKTSLIHDLNLLQHKIIRINSSGDFISLNYFKVWLEVIEMFKSKTFYSYSKVVHVLLKRLTTELPSNYKNIQSIGGKFDHLIDYNMPVAKVFKSLNDMEIANTERFLIGLNDSWVDGSKSDMVAVNGNKLIALIFHGKRGKELV